ncbi:hypothetical protein ACHHYP_08900 [Achlya hypogyna]|uniref:Lipase-like C-terminal domain-containing protein n=1 Tax=Achlya hypogyna TaxID=1202772 RepID=A0A1V9YNV3_ACHHY|nr:hypothetical protein ACHHYP_08900 [Achlya hypogyna]
MERTQQPVVMVHGAFGWGQKTPLFGTMPSYWPVQALDATNPNYIIVEVGKISSDYDRACEVFYQLYGGTVDYGEEHAATCGRCFESLCPAHLTHEQAIFALARRTPLCIQTGASLAIELYQLLCRDHFGVGSSHKWVKSITCICGPLTGSTLSNMLGIGPDSTLKLLSGGHLVGSSFALFWKLQECYLPSLKALYDLNMAQWNNVTSWADVFSPSSTLFESRDFLWDDIVPATRLQRNQALVDMDKVHLFSVVTSAKDHPNVLSGMTWFLSLFTTRLPKHEPFHGFDSRHWANNDGVVNTYSQLYPRVKCGRFTPGVGSYTPVPGVYPPLPSGSPGSASPSVGSEPDVESSRRRSHSIESHISVDLEAHVADDCAPLKGRWYTYHVEKNHFCGTYLDSDAGELYANIFKMVNKYSNARSRCCRGLMLQRVGAMGWGHVTPLFGWMPSYWPVDDLQALNPNHVIVDVGKASSDYDRACEVFFQLVGGQVDYGEAHAKACASSIGPGHKRFGTTYPKEKALHPHWSEDNPVHLVGHSCGATTALELYQLLCKDAFGFGTNHKWVKGIVSICGPLTGYLWSSGTKLTTTRSTIANLLGGDAKATLSYQSAGYAIGTALTVLWKLQEFYAPWLKRVYDLGMPQWTNNTSWRWVFSAENDMYRSHDLGTLVARPDLMENEAFYDILPAKRLSKNDELVGMDKVHLMSIATRSTHHGHSLSALGYLLRRFTRELGPDALYDGFESAHWAHNDGVVNTWSQRYPRADSGEADSDDQSVVDLESSDSMVPGRWYSRLLEGRNHLCGTHWDPDARSLYTQVFRQIASWE